MDEIVESRDASVIETKRHNCEIQTERVIVAQCWISAFRFEISTATQASSTFLRNFEHTTATEYEINLHPSCIHHSIIISLTSDVGISLQLLCDSSVYCGLPLCVEFDKPVLLQHISHTDTYSHTAPLTQLLSHSFCHTAALTQLLLKGMKACQSIPGSHNIASFIGHPLPKDTSSSRALTCHSEVNLSKTI